MKELNIVKHWALAWEMSAAMCWDWDTINHNLAPMCQPLECFPLGQFYWDSSMPRSVECCLNAKGCHSHITLKVSSVIQFVVRSVTFQNWTRYCCSILQSLSELHGSCQSSSYLSTSSNILAQCRESWGGMRQITWGGLLLKVYLAPRCLMVLLFSKAFNE